MLKFNLRFRVGTLMLVIGLVGMSILALRTYLEFRLVPRPEDDPLSSGHETSTAPFPSILSRPPAPDPWEAHRAIVDALQSGFPLASLASTSSRPAATSSDHIKAMKLVMDDADFQKNDFSNYKGASDVDRIYLGEWRCNLESCWYYRPFVIDGTRKYRVTGRFIRTLEKRWIARFERFVRVMTRDEYAALDKLHQTELVSVEFIPTPAEARDALVAWLRDEVRVDPRRRGVHAHLSGHLRRSPGLDRIVDGAIQDHPGYSEVEGWKLYLDDLWFEKPIPRVADATTSPVRLNGYFEFSTGRGWMIGVSYLDEWDVHWSCEPSDPGASSHGLAHFPHP